MVEKMCSELALQPVATALFSSSPFRAGLIPFYPPPSTYTSPTFPNSPTQMLLAAHLTCIVGHMFACMN